MCLMMFGAVASAQPMPTEPDDRGYLQAFLEDNLSDVGRDIRIIGFEGAFSSTAFVKQITLGDDDGIWLTLNEVELQWSRASLLRGAVDISKLSAAEIILARRPMSHGGPPAPEAQGFSLPELPVSIQIGALTSERVVLGETVFGTAAILDVKGAGHLIDGAAKAQLNIRRIDGQRGNIKLDTSFQNATQYLNIDLNMEEGKDGIAANILDLPGRPDIELSVSGKGDPSNFAAEVLLATDGAKRLSGTVRLAEAASEIEASNDQPAQGFLAKLSGDIAPLLAPEYGDFFGDNITLSANGLREADGVLDLKTFSLLSQALDLKGSLTLTADGWPTQLAVKGQLKGAADKPVVLPIKGGSTQLQNADLSIDFDAQKGDSWQANFILDGLQRDELAVDQLAISATGVLRQGEGAEIGYLEGLLHTTSQGMSFPTPELQAAIGASLTGDVTFNWIEDQPLKLFNIDLRADDYRLTGGLTMDEPEAGLNVKSAPDLKLSARNISRFSGLAGRSLSGAVEMITTGKLNLLGGAFDLELRGAGKELAVDQQQFDPLIAGASQLHIAVVRDADGTRINQFEIETKALSAQLSADLKTNKSTAQFEIGVADMSRVDAGFSGSASFVGTLRQVDSDWFVVSDVLAPGDLKARLEGSVVLDRGVPGLAKGTINATLNSLSPYAQLLGQPVSGGLTGTLSGRYDVPSGEFVADLSGTGRNVKMGNPTVDVVTQGESQLSAKLHRGQNERVVLDQFALKTNELNVKANGQSVNGKHNVSFAADLRDLAALGVDISGPVNAQGTAALANERWTIDAVAKGPAQASGVLTGSINADATDAQLNLNGNAPLSLANPYIKPRLVSGRAEMNLALNGPLTLSSVSGELRTEQGRLTLPTLRQAVTIDRALVTLSEGQARLNVQNSLEGAGNIRTNGVISLQSPYMADVKATLDQLVLSDGVLFETTLNGDVFLQGPLVDGARISADIALDRTEIHITEVPSSSVPILEQLQHINEPSRVHDTRKFAGLIVETRQESAPLRAFPIDIKLRVGRQMFVRGRGLDAELSGALRLTGTTENIVPVGQFDLIRGRLNILGKRLDLSQGNVVMQGGFDPSLYFKAQSQAEDTVINITLSGPASQPEVSFTSSPERPDDEVLALLLFGRDITQISAFQALRLAAAIRTLAGKGSDNIVSKLRNEFGLDDLELSTDENGEATVAAGKYISDNIYTNVELGTNSEAKINLNLSLSPSLTARGSADSEGNTSVGIFFERDY